MFLTGYPLTSVLLMAALALSVALILRLIDRKLRLLITIPSLIRFWEKICINLVQKLDRQGRSRDTLASRAKILILTLLAFAALMGNLLAYFLSPINDWVETSLLALCLLALPRNSLTPLASDEAGRLRHQVESDGVRLLQRILAPVSGWILLGWPGVLMAITIIALRNAVAQVNSHFGPPIRLTAKAFLFLPGLLGIFATAIAAFFTSRCQPLNAMRAGFEAMLTPHKALMLTLSEAMGISLAGPKTHYRDLIGRKWLGKGSARLQSADIARWHWLLALSQLLIILLFLLLSATI